MKPLHCAVFALILACAACSSGKKLLQKGQYDEAVFKAVNRLKQKPDSRDATVTLREAWGIANRQIEDKITQWVSAPPSEKKWDELVAAFRQLDELQRAVSSSPVAYRIAGEPPAVTSRANEAYDRAATWYASEAGRINTAQSRDDARAAFRLAYKSLQLRPQENTTRQVLRRAYEDACLLVSVRFIQRTPAITGGAMTAFNQSVSQQLRAIESRNFVRFSTGSRSAETADESIRFELQDFNPGQQQIASKVIDCVNDSVATEIRDKEGVIRRGYRTARARLTLYEGTVTAGIAMSASVAGANGGNPETVMLPGSFVWKARWATYKGDLEALTPAQIELTRIPAAIPPPPDVLLAEAMKPVTSAALQLLNRRYSRNEISAAQSALLADR